MPLSRDGGVKGEKMRATKKRGRGPRKISQTEARKLRRRVEELERMRRTMFARYGTDFEGTHIGYMSLSRDNSTVVSIRTARALGYGIAVTESGGELNFYAIDQKEAKP